MGGGAWPFLVGGVICLVNSDNERDLDQLTSCTRASARCTRLRASEKLLRGTVDTYTDNQSEEGNNRSVMPLDVLGCTRVTLLEATSSVAAVVSAMGWRAVDISLAERSG